MTTCIHCPRGIAAICLAVALALSVLHHEAAAVETVLTDRLHHLRGEGPREWTEFPETPEAASLELKFHATPNATEYALSLRQQDVKQNWRVRLNGKDLGRLVVDENDMVLCLAVPAGTLVEGENVLRIEAGGRHAQPDDIRIGEIALRARTRDAVLSEAMVEVEIVDAETSRRLPARVTIVNSRGALQTVGAVSGGELAVRPGIVYTGDGRARFGLPAGKYTLYAGRGFEYSLDQCEAELAAGQSLRRTLKIRREVDTSGYVACDTHVHTLTYSGHGDATAEERMITLAAEGIELPIATDHNRHIDHEPLARKMGLRRHFTPVVGNEVTTPVGHFNVFPAQANAPVPDFRPRDWNAIFANIYRTPDVKVVILNHARDLHSGVRPFGPKLHNGAVGENVEGWRLRANAMEVVNSGAVQSDPLQLLRDWMVQLNHGRRLTPAGASDSHDVGRHFVGQGRTYIRARDDDPGDIHIDEAVQNFLLGRVMVSYGLLAELTVDGRYGPGEVAPVPNERVNVHINVLGPHWVRAKRVLLFSNGELVRDEPILPAPDAVPGPNGVKFEVSCQLPKPRHDVHLVAVALGEGVDGFYWKTAKPYQPTSPEFQSQTIGASGAVWLDADGDGRATPAIDYARRIVDASRDLPSLISGLAEYDEAVAAQAAWLYRRTGDVWLADEAQAALKQAAPAAARGVRAYVEAWRENQIARSEP
jgi:hypothetical protein